MVAKISHGEQLFGAVTYNQHKVDNGNARIIAGNRMIADIAENPDRQIHLTMLAFSNHLLANRNTERPILHISLNPSLGDTLSDTQFATLAEDYMQKMGYGEQPYIVYLHEDTGRRHIHIVSVCIDERGRKIDDKYEWRRSMKVCRELERKFGLENVTGGKRTTLYESLRRANFSDYGNAKHRIRNTLEALHSTYRYRSFGEWSALLSVFNIGVELIRGEFEGKPYNGIVYTITDDNGIAISEPIKSSLIGKRFGYDELKRCMARNAKVMRNKKPAAEIRRTIALALHGSRGNRDAFIRSLRDANIDVVFRENKNGRIYGATFIDHGSREVFNGSRLGKEFSANVFERMFREADIEKIVTEQAASDRSAADAAESALEQALGILSLGNVVGSPTTEDIEEESFAKAMQNKVRKRKRRAKGIS